MSIRPSLQLHFAGADWAATAPPPAERCTCHACDWRGNRIEVRPLSRPADWLDCQDTTDVVILPEGECPACGAPVYNAAAEIALARLQAAAQLFAKAS